MSKDSRSAEEEAAIKEELKLPLQKMFSGGQVVMEVRGKQAVIDKLAETDLDAALEMARNEKERIAETARLQRQEAEDKKRERERSASGYAAKQRAEDDRRKETRRQIAGALEALGQAQDVDGFLGAAEQLLANQESLNTGDLKMYAAKRDQISEQAWSDEQTNRMRQLEGLNTAASKAVREDVERRAGEAKFFIPGPLGYKEVVPGAKTAKVESPKPEKPKPSSVWDKIKKWF